MYFFRNLLYKIVDIDNRKLTIYTLVFILTNALLFTIIEPETFPNLFISLWYVLVTMTTVGYGDVYPTTVIGKVFGIFLFGTGIALGGVIIGKVVESFTMYKRRREEGKLEYKNKEHIVIIGWNSKTDAAIEEILSDEKAEVVIIDQLEKAPYLKERVYYIQGPPTKKETLYMANIQHAKACIVFADEKIRDFDDRDAKSLLTISTIESISEGIYTIVEIMNPDHTENFKHNKVEKFLYPQSTISHMAVQEAMNHGILEVFNQLGSVQHGVNLYIIERKKSWITYKDAFMDLLNLGATLLADGKDMDINTKLNYKIPDQNKLIILCTEEIYRQNFL